MGLDVDALLRVAPESTWLTDTAIDPERAYDEGNDAASQDSGSEEEMSADAARKHYVDVGASQMRKGRLTDSDALDKGRYSGVKTSRAEMFGDRDEEDEEDEEEDSGDDDQGGDDEVDEELDGPEEDFEDAENGIDEEDEDEGEGEDVEDDQDDDDDADEDEDDEEIPSDDNDMPEESGQGSRGKSSGPRGTKREADSDAPPQEDATDLLSQLHSRQAQDAKKGRHVQKQVRAWEQALRTRIAMQKTNTQVGRLPPSEEMEAYLDASSEARESLDTAAVELEDIASTLLSLRLRLWQQNIPALSDELSSKVNVEASGPKALHDLETALEPHRRLLLTRWSNKIAAAPESRNAPGSKLQLRAMNQGVVEQLDQALSGDGLARLVERTRVWRPTDVERLGVPATETPDSRSAQAVDVFDDSDFYAQLLRDLVDNAGLMQAGTSAYASDALQSRKRKRAVDVRASKGRRIRYEVIDKVQNFMPPIPRVTWSDEQAQRLFSRLAGARQDEEEPEEAADEAVVPDGFRLFA